MKKRTKILIVGAGPTGLMMAAQLQRFGVGYIIIDPKTGVVKESRALAVQARTLQIYEQLGIARDAIAQGTPANKIKVIINGRRLYEVPLSQLGQGLTAYPFLFVLEQNKNEKLLYDHLLKAGGDVMWEHSLENFSQHENGITAIAENSAGETIEIEADWLIGADGAKSQVRHTLGVNFEGGTYENIFIVADTHAEWPWGHDCLSLCLTANGFAGLFPMKGEDRFRLIATFPKKFLPNEVTEFSQIEKAVEEQIKIDVPFAQTNWFSIYRVHHRCVNRFRYNRIFLAGDAAHVHSPAGGQGMNTGLQDAYNLAWKLALVVKEWAGEDLLNSYNDERLPVARRLVKTTDRAFAVVTSRNWLFRFIRIYIIPPILGTALSIRSVGRFAYRAVSQIAINYRRSFISHSENSNLLQAGSLVPYVRLNGSRIDEHLKFDGCTIFIFDSLVTDQQKKELQDIFLVPFKFVEVRRVADNEEAFKQFKVNSTAIFLVRPDNYIGYAAETVSFTDLRKYLRDGLRLFEKPA